MRSSGDDAAVQEAWHHMVNSLHGGWWGYQAALGHRNLDPVLEFTLMSWKFEYEGRYLRAERRALNHRRLVTPEPDDLRRWDAIFCINIVPWLNITKSLRLVGTS